MTDPRFLQIHFLAPYTAALLNRDDAGLAKRLPFGGSWRTRVSSQCLKRHWRVTDDPHALPKISGEARSIRSRSLVGRYIAKSVPEDVSSEVVDALSQWFNFAIYSGSGDKAPRKRGNTADMDEKSNRPTLLFGASELRWLCEEFTRLAVEADGDADKAFSLGKEWVGLKPKGQSEFLKARSKNLEALKKAVELPAGLTAALFGRMVTSDPRANIDAALHVAHAFTVHAEEAESDYFVAVDDLAEADDTGADTIQDTELTSGLFYGYVVVDLPALHLNLGGDVGLMGEVLHNLIYLIAEVSPGAKLGSTAPYSRASFMLLEAGDRQPRSLADAYRIPCRAETSAAVAALCNHLAAMDQAYDTGETRHVMSLLNREVPSATRGSLRDLAAFAKSLAPQEAD